MKSSPSIKTLFDTQHDILRQAQSHLQATRDARYALKQIPHPYLSYLAVALFTGKKLILYTDWPEMLAKCRENNASLIATIQNHTTFKQLNSLEVRFGYVDYSAPVVTSRPTPKQPLTNGSISPAMRQAFQNLASHIDDQKTQKAIEQLLKRNVYE